MNDGDDLAKRLLRREMAARGVSWKTLAERLRAGGDAESTEKALRDRWSRGSFSASWLLRLLLALGVTTLRLDE